MTARGDQSPVSAHSSGRPQRRSRSSAGGHVRCSSTGPAPDPRLSLASASIDPLAQQVDVTQVVRVLLDRSDQRLMQ